MKTVFLILLGVFIGLSLFAFNVIASTDLNIEQILNNVWDTSNDTLRITGQ